MRAISMRNMAIRSSKRWTVAVDVDGVLHTYTSGWQGADVLPDPPVPGAIEWLEQITEEYDVAICSTRCATPEGCAAVEEWLRAHGLSDRAQASVYVTEGKPPALIYVDDRGWRFTGENFPTVEQVEAALPWWKKAR